MCTCNNLKPHKFYILQEALKEMMASYHLLKRAICNMTLPMINTTSPSSLSHSVVTFCQSNSTLFESTLHMINQVCLFACIYTVCGCVPARAPIFSVYK